jgi:predicted metal-dependent peptidase
MSESIQARGGMLPAVEQNPTEISKQNLITTRVDLVRLFPFMSFLIMSSTYHFTKQIPTMCATTINGNQIFVNEDFLNTLTRKQRAFVIAHEILHIFLEHVGRATERAYHPKLWNVAADFMINSFLIDLENSSIEMPKMGLYDKKYKSMSADEIYHKLLEENDQDPDKAVEQYGGGEPSDNQDGDGMGGDPFNGDDGTPRPFDHISREPMSEAEKVENHQKISASLAQSNIDAIKQMGKGYADLIRQLESLVESVIPWQNVLREFITTNSKNRYTYDRVSRKSYHGGIVFPTLTGDDVSLVFGVDTSGSMSEKDLTEAMSELYAICEEFDNWNVDLVSCDTVAHSIGEYSSEEGDDFTTIDKGLIGGGGTDMTPIVEYCNEKDENIPSVCVIITDGYIPEIEEIDEIPVICVVTTEGNQDLELENALVISMKDTVSS